MPKSNAKTKTKRPTEADLDDFTIGAIEAINERLLVQQFNALWDQMDKGSKSEIELFVAAIGTVGRLCTGISDALVSLKKGKAPSIVVGKTELARAACHFAEHGTYKAKKKAKRKTAKDRDKRRHRPGHGTTKPTAK